LIKDFKKALSVAPGNDEKARLEKIPLGRLPGDLIFFKYQNT
jgi:hypothetical protein